MPLYNPPSVGTPIGSLGIMVQHPTNVDTGYSWGYNTAAKALPPYTSDPKSSAFTGGLLDLLQAARLADLNSVRVAVENLRVFTENLAKQHNAITIELANAGLIST